MAELAAETGIRRMPRIERGPASQRDAFSYGAPGRPRVVLPPAVAVRWRDRELFDPLVRHELAHVRHRDVALAWLARSVWYALAPLLILPLVVSLLSSDHSILADLLWRAALLGLTVLLVSAALLRSREYDADLRAARVAGEIESLTALLRRSSGGHDRNPLRQLVARHPTPDQRILVLQDPERAAGVTFLDGFSPAFLAGLLFPLVSTVVVVMFTGSGRTDLGDSVAALVAGPLLGGSVGLGLWRAAVAGRVAGIRRQAGPVALGVAAGLVLGQLASLAGTGSGTAGGLDHPALLAVSAALGVGATVLSAGLAQLGADAAPRLHRRVAIVAIVAIDGLVFASALWIGSTLQFALDSSGLALARAWLVTLLPSAGLVIGTVAVLALSAGWALWARTDRATAPAWMIEDGNPLRLAVRRHPRPAVGHGRARLRDSRRGLPGRVPLHRRASCLPRHPGAAVLPVHLGGRGGRRRVHPRAVLAGPGPRSGPSLPRRAAGHADRRGRIPGREHRPRRQPQRPLRGHRRPGSPRPRTAVRPDRRSGRADPAGFAVTGPHGPGPHPSGSPADRARARRRLRRCRVHAAHRRPRSDRRAARPRWYPGTQKVRLWSLPPSSTACGT